MEHTTWHGSSSISSTVQLFESVSSWWTSPWYEERCHSSFVPALRRNEFFLFCFIFLDEYRWDIIINPHWHWWKSPVCHSWTQGCEHGVTNIFTLSVLWWIPSPGRVRYQSKGSWSWEISKCHEGPISHSNCRGRRYSLYSTDVVASGYI